MKTNLLSSFFYLFPLLLSAQNNSTAFFERRGYALTYAPSWYDAHIHESVGIGLYPTRGFQTSLAYYLRPSEHWGVELGIGVGYHPFDARLNLLTTQYPKLPFDLKNGRLQTADYYVQFPLKVHYYQPLSPRLSLDYTLGTSAWVYSYNGDAATYNQGSIGQVALEWESKSTLNYKLLAGVGAQYQLLPWLATRATLGYDFGIKPSITGLYSIRTEENKYHTGFFTSRGSAAKAEISLLLTNRKAVDYKAKKGTWQQQKGDVGLDCGLLLSTDVTFNSFFSIKEDSASAYGYLDRDGVFNANLSYALAKYWAVQLGFSRIYNSSYTSISFKNSPLGLGGTPKNESHHTSWAENQLNLGVQYQYPLTKRLVLKSKVGLMLFLHYYEFQFRGNTFGTISSPLIEEKINLPQNQTLGFNGEVGAELRLIKPLSLISSFGYIYNFKKVVYAKTGTIQLLQQKYAINTTSTFRMPVFSLGLKYNLGYHYNGNKESYWW